MKIKPVCILIIDDNPDFLFTMGTFLEQNGYRILTADNGKTAWELFQKERPDLVLLDVMMETMFAGFEVCKRIRKDPDLFDTPIIGISGMAGELGVFFDRYPDYAYFSPDEFIEKPVDKQNLLTRIEAVLKQAQIRKARPKWEKELEAVQESLLRPKTLDQDLEGDLESIFTQWVYPLDEPAYLAVAGFLKQASEEMGPGEEERASILAKVLALAMCRANLFEFDRLVLLPPKKDPFFSNRPITR